MEPLPPAPPGVLVERFAPSSRVGYRHQASPPTLRISFHRHGSTRRARIEDAAVFLSGAILLLGVAGFVAQIPRFGVLCVCVSLGPLGLFSAYKAVASVAERVVIECGDGRFRARVRPGLFHRRVDLAIADIERVDVEHSRLDGIDRVFVRAAGTAHVLPGLPRDGHRAVARYVAAVIAQHLDERVSASRRPRDPDGAELPSA